MKLICMVGVWVALSAVGFGLLYVVYFKPRTHAWTNRDDVRMNGIVVGWICFSLSLSTWIFFGLNWPSLIPLFIGGLNAYGAFVKLRQMPK